MSKEKAPLSIKKEERKFKVINCGTGEVLYVGGLEEAFDFFCDKNCGIEQSGSSLDS